MKLHVFNPEHDLALAAHRSNFTAPHAGRALRVDLGFLPACWAEQGDAVLVEDAASARIRFHRLSAGAKKHLPDPLFVTKNDLSGLAIDGVEPWGWNLALRAQLLRYGVKESLLPTTDEIEEIRKLSHRSFSARVLHEINVSGTIGDAYLCTTFDEIEEKLAKHPRLVLKAPWSSSGRGIRFLLSAEMTPSLRGWVKNTLRTQGSVMIEPYYNKVKDFGMEFFADEAGQVHYLGLSLFHTANGAYTGNILASEEVKREMLSRYISLDILCAVQESLTSIIGRLLGSKYHGPLGVDMMMVKVDGEVLVHPCVEINMRRTMGHTALSLSPTNDAVKRVMRISLEGHYKMRTRKI